MKKFLILCILCCGVAFSAQSQEFKPFRFDLGGGYGLPFTKGIDGGVIFYLEPKYAVMEKLSVGVRWEGALFAGTEANADGTEKATVKLNSGYLLTGDYYFNNNKFRPFAGLGLGAYSIAGASATFSENVNEPVVSSSKTNFAAMLRAGFDVSHFRLALSYNFAGKVGDATYHYLGITVGAYIGGGRK